MIRRAAALLACAGCQQAPHFYGLWDIDHATIGGRTQHEVGQFEIADDDTISLILSYGYSGDFVPDPSPATITGGASFGDVGTEDDPRYQLVLTPFGDTPFDVVEFGGGAAELHNPAAVWPGGGAGTFELTLSIAR